MELTEAVVKRLEEIMREKGFSAYKLHRKGGIAKSTLSQVINGTRKSIELPTLYQILATMEVSLGEFFTSPIFAEVTD